jgi:hypothetical protein
MPLYSEAQHARLNRELLFCNISSSLRRLPCCNAPLQHLGAYSFALTSFFFAYNIRGHMCTQIG